MTERERDELLVRLDERVSHLQKLVTEHLQHHWTAILGVSLSGLTALTALVIALLKGG